MVVRRVVGEERVLSAGPSGTSFGIVVCTPIRSRALEARRAYATPLVCCHVDAEASAVEEVRGVKVES